MKKEFAEKDYPDTDSILNTLMLGGIAFVCGLIVVLQAAQAVIA